MEEAGKRRSLPAWAWVLVALSALLEVGAQPAIRAAVPDDASWDAAAQFVRERYRPSDRIVAAPRWADPRVRELLGDLLSLRMAAAPDDGGVERIWELGIRGKTTRTDTPDIDEEFGGVRVRMWRLSSPAVLYDFVERVPEAEVELVRPDGTGRCPYRRVPPDRGGLARGPMPPESRFVCDGKRPWLWVGATVLADLDLEPRRCVWQHPAGPEPFRVTYTGVPLGDRLVVHAGIDYTAERQRRHSPVTLRVFIDDELVGELVHRDGDGWAGTSIDISSREGPVAVRFETTAEDSRARLFCWAASMQAGAGE